MQHFGPPLFHDIDFKRFWRKYHTEYRFNISYKYKCLLLKWVTNWLCNLLEFEKKKVTPCTQEYGLTSLVETDQWHCREGLRLYLPKLKEAVIQTIDRLTQRQTDDRDSLLWIRSEMQKQINTIQHKKHMLGFHNNRWLFTNWTDTDSTHVMYMQAARGENKMNK